MRTVERITKHILRFCHAHECQREQITTVSLSLFAHDVSQRASTRIEASASVSLRVIFFTLPFMCVFVAHSCRYMLFLPHLLRSAVDCAQRKNTSAKSENIGERSDARVAHATVSAIPLPCAICSLKVPIGLTMGIISLT